MSITSLLFLFFLHLGLHAQLIPTFSDRFPRNGLPGAPIASLKFGGPCIADVDSDGNYDLILNFHNRNFSRIYFGDGNFKFRIFIDPRTNLPFRPIVFDVHGIAVARLHTRTRDRLISFSVGGGSGTNLRSAEVFRMTPDRVITDVTNEMGLGVLRSRPRNAIFMNLALNTNMRRRMNFGGPDVLFTNFLVPPMGLTQFGYANERGKFLPREDVGDFTDQRRGRVELTDWDGDGNMEVVSIRQFRFYKLTAPFILTDVTDDVLPFGLSVGFLTVSSMVELDFDNDGDYDLYVARADRPLISRLGPLGDDQRSDILLRNDGGVYTDVSAQAGIPADTDSIGVTTGDLNNDGYADLVVVLVNEPDMVLLNKGDGTFTRVDGLIEKGEGVIGNHAQAADLDKDGRVDVVVGHGGVGGNDLGPYLILENQLVMGANTHYLLVTVLNDPTRATTSLHAVVTIIMPRRRRIVRRVGSRGGQDGYGSYIDTLHFGLGSETSVSRVNCRWATGIQRNMFSVAADQLITFGRD